MNSYRFLLLCVACFCSVCLRQASAQSPSKPSGAGLTYSVVSIRQSDLSQRNVQSRILANGFVEKQNSIFWLIQVAYGLKEDRTLIGAPEWTRNEYYDVDARVDDAAVSQYEQLSEADKLALLQNVLTDRFGLRAHVEQRPLANYSLTVAPTGSKLGSPVDEQTPLEWKITDRYRLSAKGATMAMLANMVLSTETQRLVIDDTGLRGKYNFSLIWSRESAASDSSTQSASEGPSIFTAIREQLGLRLRSVTVMTPVLVVETVRRPTPN